MTVSRMLPVLLVLGLSSAGCQGAKGFVPVPSTSPSPTLAPGPSSSATPGPSPTPSAGLASPTPSPGSTFPSPSPAVVSFSGTLAPLIQNTCANCHGANGTFPRMVDSGGHADYAGITANLSSIVAQVQSGSMPRGSASWTSTQVNQLVSWQNAGAPQN